MEGVMVSTATGAMNSVLSKLFKLLSFEFNLFSGIRKEIEFLRHELIYMNALLHKLANMEELDVQMHLWKNKVRELSYDIEDCIDIFMHHLGNNNDEKAGLVHEATKMLKRLWVCHQVSKQIQQLKDRVVQENERRKRYKLDDGTSDPRAVEIDPRLPALYAHAGQLVGVDGPRETIIRWLIEDGGRGSSQQLKIFSIVGFGGLGKTTLANQVFCKIKDKFDCTAFISVSQKPNLSKIFKDILSEIGSGVIGDPDADLQICIKKIREHLTNKRYLIIIDDLWSIKAWDIIKCAFVQDNNGSAVITTTRIQDVATACCFPCHDHVYQMQCLDELYSRRLFFSRVFGTEDGCPEQFKDVSDDMLRKCKGVPLAVTSIASLLANQRMHVGIWEKIRNSMGYELDTNPTMEWMRHVLNLSYNDLSHELKTCLLYLGTYPEDHAIGKFDLVRKWIAEGFIREKHGLDLEQVAENCFNELANRSMIQPFFDDSDEEWSCRVHDLMLDLIISKCSEENFTTIIDRQFKMNGASPVRRISHQSDNSNIAQAVDRMSLAQVRSYNSFPRVDFMPLLTKFELLRVLDIDHGSYAVPESMCFDLSAINHLFLLRYLKIRGFRLKLPEKFGKLDYLMTLDMSRGKLCSSHQSSDFTSLSSLRHLSLTMFEPGVVLRNGLSKLCNLRTLFHFDIRTNSAECIRDLSELTNLKELSVSYSMPFGVQENPDTRILKYDVLATSLDKLGSSNLQDLDIVNSSGTPTQFWDNCFTRPSNLQRLWLPKLLLPKIPNWIVHADRLENLKKLIVQELRRDDFLVLAQLPCLMYLFLEAKKIPDRNTVIQSNTFPNLKKFHFWCELSCVTFEPAAMPRLQTLKIALDGCGQGAVEVQEGSPVAGIQYLASLEQISVIIHVKCGLGSNIESSCRDAIVRHPKREAIQIHLECIEYGQNGHRVNTGR